MIEVQHTISLSAGDLSDLFVTAFEGGSNYWVKGAHPLSPTPPGDVVWWGRTGFFENPDFSFKLTQLDDDEKITVTRASVEKGLQLLADRYPSHLADYLLGEWDADTADVFLQLCAFGDIIYG